MEEILKKNKTRKSDRIYLIREIRELWSKLSPGDILKINKVRAHIIGEHDEDFTKKQAVQGLWTFHIEVKKGSGIYKYTANPVIVNRKLVGIQKVTNDAIGRVILEKRYKEVFNKDAKRIETHKDFMDQDIKRKVLPKRTGHQIILGLDSNIRALLPEHKETKN